LKSVYFLLTLAMVLGLVLAAEWLLVGQRGPAAVSKPRSAELQPPAIETRDFDLPAISIYREIAERPLFTPTRLPREHARRYGNQKAGRFPDHVRVQSLVISPTLRRATFYDTERDAAEVVEVGGRIHGWTVFAIRHDGILVRRGPLSKLLPVSGTATESEP